MERTPNNAVLTDLSQEIRSRNFVHEEPVKYIEYDAREINLNSARTSLDTVNLVDEKAFLDTEKANLTSNPENSVSLMPQVYDATIPTFIQNPVAVTPDQLLNQQNENQAQYVKHYANKYDYANTAEKQAKTIGASYTNYNFVNTDAGAGFYSFKNAASFMGFSIGKGYDASYVDKRFMDFASKNGYASSYSSSVAQYNDFKNQILDATIKSMDRGQHAANLTALTQAQTQYANILGQYQSAKNAGNAAVYKSLRYQKKNALKALSKAEIAELNSRPYELSSADVALPFDKMARNDLSSEMAILSKALYNELNVNVANGGIMKDKETGRYYIEAKDVDKIRHLEYAKEGSLIKRSAENVGKGIANFGYNNFDKEPVTKLWLTDTETAQYELFKSLERQQKHNNRFTFKFKPFSKDTLKNRYKQQLAQTDAGMGMSQLKSSWHQFSTMLGAPVYKTIGKANRIAASVNLKKMQKAELTGGKVKSYNGLKWEIKRDGGPEGKKRLEIWGIKQKIKDKDFYARKYNRNMRISRFMQGPKAWAQDGGKWLLQHSRIGRKYLSAKDTAQKAVKKALTKFLAKTKLNNVIAIFSKILAPIMPAITCVLLLIIIINLLLPVSWLEGSEIDVNAVIDRMLETEGDFIKDVEFTYDLKCNERDENGNKLHPYHTAEISGFSGDRSDDFNNLDLATLTDQNATHCMLIDKTEPGHLEMRQYDTTTLYKTIIAMQHARQDLFWEEGVFDSEAKQADVEEYCSQLLKKILYTCYSEDNDGRISIRISHTGLTDAMRLDEEKITTQYISLKEGGITTELDDDGIAIGFAPLTIPIYKDGITHRPTIWSVIGSFFTSETWNEFTDDLDAWNNYLDGYWSKYHRDELEIVRTLWEMTDDEWMEMGIQLPSANELTGDMGPCIDYATIQEVENNLTEQGLNPYRIKVITTALKECGKHIYGKRSSNAYFPFKLDCSDFVSGALCAPGVPGAVDATCYGIVKMAENSLNQAYSVKYNAARPSYYTKELIPGDIMVKNKTKGAEVNGQISSENHVVLYVGAVPGYGEHCVVECTTKRRYRNGINGQNVITGVAVSGFNTLNDLFSKYSYQYIIDPYGLCPDEIEDKPTIDDVVPEG